MGKLKVCNLSLEVTRRCNMNCEHCLRGDAQNMDADLALIPKIFAGIDDIDTITFTGGEPALNTAYIKAVVDYVIEHKIPVHGCFVATNGKIYSQELVDCVRRLWEKEQSYGDQFISPVKWVLTHADDEEEYSFFNIAVSGDQVPRGHPGCEYAALLPLRLLLQDEDAKREAGVYPGTRPWRIHPWVVRPNYYPAVYRGIQ